MHSKSFIWNFRSWIRIEDRRLNHPIFKDQLDPNQTGMIFSPSYLDLSEFEWSCQAKFFDILHCRPSKFFVSNVISKSLEVLQRETGYVEGWSFFQLTAFKHRM